MKKADLEFWRKEFKGRTASDIVNRIILRFEPDDDDGNNVDPEQELKDQESGEEDELPISMDHDSEIDEESNTTQTEDISRILFCTGSRTGDSWVEPSSDNSERPVVESRPHHPIQRHPIISCLPDSVNYRYEDVLPAYWPDPRSDEYQGFFHSFFTGQVLGAVGHNWSEELQQSKSVQATRAQKNLHALTVWQAAGYLHAKRIISIPSIKGCLYYWTPGSGKSIMIALLLDVLYQTDYKVYVVSSPQNIRQNDLDCCAKSLLKFSPRFNLGGREPTSDDVKEMRRTLRRRPNGPPILVKNFMTFRQFGRFCVENGPEKILEKTALIIDESHLLFDEKKCDKDVMWGVVLETLTKCTDSKIFTFSGTPGKNQTELLLQLELVRHSSNRIDHSSLLQETDGWLKRLGSYAQGLVSYVDGTKDLSRYPVNGGVDTVAVEMSQTQMYNFSKRCQIQLRAFSAADIEGLLAPIRDGSGERWKDAVRKARLTQTAGTVFWGGSRSGLCSVLSRSELPSDPDLEALVPVTPEILSKYAPKFRAIALCVLNPPGTESLETKHFIYSSNQASVSYLTRILNRLQSIAGLPLFKQLFAQDFEWTSSEERELRLAKGFELAHPRQIMFVVLNGTVDEKKKLKAAFGQITPDGTRYEGLKRACGPPLIQAVLGTHESNQGLTFLRLQHIHLIEPNPRGWSEVLFTIFLPLRTPLCTCAGLSCHH